VVIKLDAKVPCYWPKYNYPKPLRW